MNKDPNPPGDITQKPGSTGRAIEGRLTPSDAHEFNNMVAVIKLYAQLGLRNPTVNEELKETFRVILEQSAAARKLIDKIMEAGNHQSSEK